MKYYWKLMR